ncbi:MAG: hypothetical protein ACJ72H_27660, partial [Candidatus Sulfotelmatobacter sp.]
GIGDPEDRRMVVVGVKGKDLCAGISRQGEDARYFTRVQIVIDRRARFNANVGVELIVDLGGVLR